MKAVEPGPSVPGPRHPAAEDLDGLLAAVARGERAAFDPVYEQLSGPVYRLARTVIGDPAQAEEVTQEVLLEMWRTAFSYDPDKGNAAAWALTIARRRAIDRVRAAAAASARERRNAVPAVPWDQVSETVEDNFDRELLLRSIDRLNDRQREVITLAFYGGYTYAEVAYLLGLACGTVKGRIRDALIRLRTCMQECLSGSSFPG
jgi:RNA polymerase sigma-70 factor (ECF subfamily)